MKDLLLIPLPKEATNLQVVENILSYDFDLLKAVDIPSWDRRIMPEAPHYTLIGLASEILKSEELAASFVPSKETSYGLRYKNLFLQEDPLGMPIAQSLHKTAIASFQSLLQSRGIDLTNSDCAVLVKR